MRLFTHTIVIAQPREQVFAFFEDFAQASRWRAFVRTMTPRERGPLHVGSRIDVTMDLLGEPYGFDLEVLAYEPPVLWRHRTHEADFSGVIEYRFDPDANGTRVTLTCDAMPIGWYGWLSVPLMLLNRGRAYRDQLPSLKRALEAT